MRTLIKNGSVISATGITDHDVLCVDDKVVALIESGSNAFGDITADKVIDAQGKYVVPGGIDVHTHMELPFGGTFAQRYFRNRNYRGGSRGTTTIIDFAVQTYGENVRECLDRWFAKAEGQCAIDYAFHMILGGVDDNSLKEMDGLVAEA